MAQVLDIRLEGSLEERQALDRRMYVGLFILFGILAVFLGFTRLPTAIGKFAVVDQASTSLNQTTFGQVINPESLRSGFAWVAHGINLWDANAIGMFFAILLGGAALNTVAFAPKSKIGSWLGKTGVAGAAIGGGIGVPLFMCSACSAPVSLGFFRGGAALETSLGVILGSSLFHPVSMLAIFLLMPIQMGLARIAFGLTLLVVVVPLVSRIARRNPASCPVPGVGGDPLNLLGLASESPTQLSWGRALADGGKGWVNNSLEFALKLGPPMLIAGFAVGIVFDLLPPQALSGTGLAASWVAIIIAAAIGTVVQVPGMFEIPLTLGLLALGLDIGPATAMLLATPSFGIISFAVTRKDLGWRIPASMLLATFVLASAAGLIVGAL